MYTNNHVIDVTILNVEGEKNYIWLMMGGVRCRFSA